MYSKTSAFYIPHVPHQHGLPVNADAVHDDDMRVSDLHQQGLVLPYECANLIQLNHLDGHHH